MEAGHLLPVVGNDLCDLPTIEHFAPLIGPADAKKTLAWAGGFGETFATLDAGQGGEAGVPDCAFDAVAAGFDPDEPHHSRKMLGWLFQQIFVTKHQHARVGWAAPACNVFRPGT